MDKQIIKEDAGVGIAGGLVITAVSAALAAAYQHLRSNKLEANLLKCYDDDYLLLDIKSSTEVPAILTGFLARSKLVNRLIKKGQVALVSNMDTARLLKLHLNKQPIFNMLFTNKEISYTGQEFFKRYDDLFKILGNLRTASAITWDGIIKSFVTLGISKTIDQSSITDCAQANLYYMALVMRQLILYKDDIVKITFTSKAASIRHQY